MSNEQKLREALQAVIAAHDACMRELGEQMRAANITNFRVDGQAVIDSFAAIEKARQALATTEPVMANGLTEAETDATASVMGLATTEPEPEPTGRPEMPEPDEMGDRWLSSHVYTADQMLTYGEKCWKSGYKHGAWGDNKQTSKQSLQVEPAVNQQLTTEPFDERYRFEYEMRKRCNWSPNQFSRSPFQHDEYAEQASQDAWEAWQARAAMAKGVKG